MTLDFFEFRVLSCVMGLNQVLFKHVFFLFFLERERERGRGTKIGYKL